MQKLFFYFLACFGFCAAQTNGYLHFEQFEPGRKKGLTAVYEMLQDTTGTIWFGTRNGVFRYDGSAIREFSADERKKIGTLNFKFLSDAQGNVWIGSNNGLCCFEIKTNRLRQLLSHKGLFNENQKYLPVAFDADSALVVLVSGQGIAKLKSNRVTWLREARSGPLFFAGKTFHDKERQQLFITNTGWKGGLTNLIVDLRSNAITTSAHVPQAIFGQLKSGFLKVSGDSIYYYTAIGEMNFKIKNSFHNLAALGGMYYSNVLQINDSLVWIAYKFGIAELNLKKKQITKVLGYKGSTLSNKLTLISAFLLDKQNTVWVATEEKGLFTFNLTNNQRFQMLRNTGTENNTVMNLCFVNDTLALVAVLNEPVQLLNTHTNVFTSLPTGICGDQTKIVKLNNNTFLFNANFRMHEWCFPSGTLKDITASIPYMYHLHNFKPVTLSKNCYYALMHNSLVKVYGPENYKTKGVVFDSSSYFKTANLYADKEHNRLLVINTSYVSIYDTSLRLLDSKKINISTANTCKYNPLKKIWVAATYNGLVVYDSVFKQVRSISTQNSDLQNDVVYDFIFSEDGNVVFVSTNKGVGRCNISTGEVSNFGLNDGLGELEHNRCASATNRQFCYFGNINGITVFNPALLDLKSAPPLLLVNNVLVNGAPVSTSLQPAFVTELDLPYNQNNISVLYSVLNSAQTDGGVFKYRLAGYNNNYFVSSLAIPVNYNNLPHGDYELEIIATTDKGSQAVKKVAIHIRKPFYLTWWFISVAVGAFVLVLWYITRLIIHRRLKRKEQELETERRLYEQKTRISRDLHDNVGARLSMMLNTVNWLSKKGEAGKRDLDDLQENTRSVIQNLREAIWVMSKDKVTLEELFDRVKSYARQFTRHSSVQVEFASSMHHNPTLSSQQALNLYRIAQELLNNTIKHADATQAAFHLECTNTGRVQLRYTDNGKGFEPGNGITGNGLANMQQRAAEINGTLTYAGRNECAAGVMVLLVFTSNDVDVH